MILSRLLERMMVEHPHHTVYQLLALKNSATTASNQQSIAKATAANKLLERVKVRSSLLSELISSYDLLSSAYMELAIRVVPKGKKRVAISSKMKLLTGTFTNIPMPTVELEVSEASDYSSAVKILRFDDVTTKSAALT
jgi:hypothetical protein